MPKKPDPAPTVTEGRSRRTPKPNPKYATDFVQNVRAVTPERSASGDKPDDEYKPQAKKRLLDESLSPNQSGSTVAKPKQTKSVTEADSKTPAKKIVARVEKKATPASKLQTLRQQAQKQGLGLAKKVPTPAKTTASPTGPNKTATKTPVSGVKRQDSKRNDNLDDFKIVDVSAIIGGDGKRKADAIEEETSRSKKAKKEEVIDLIDIEDEISQATPIKNQPKGTKTPAAKVGSTKSDNKLPATTQRVTRQSPQVAASQAKATGKSPSPALGKASPAAAPKQSPLAKQQVTTATKTPVATKTPIPTQSKPTTPLQTKQTGVIKTGPPPTKPGTRAVGAQQKSIIQTQTRTLKQLTADLQHTPSVSRSNSETDSDIELEGVSPLPGDKKSNLIDKKLLTQQQAKKIEEIKRSIGGTSIVKSPTGITTKIVSKFQQQQQGKVTQGGTGKPLGTQTVRAVVSPTNKTFGTQLVKSPVGNLKSPITTIKSPQPGKPGAILNKPITSTPIRTPIAAKTPVTQTGTKIIAREGNTPTAVSRIIGGKSPPNKPFAIQNVKTLITAKAAPIRPQAIQRPATSAASEPEKSLEKTTNLEKWFVLNFPSVSQQPPRAVLCLSLIKLGNNIKEMKLPSANWSYRITLQRINKENTDVKEVYTGDIEDSGIEEKDKGNYAPVNISFQCVANPEDPEAKPIKSVTFQNKSFAIYLNDRQCRLIGSPQYIYDLVEIQTLLEVVDLVDNQHSYVDYDIK